MVNWNSDAGRVPLRCGECGFLGARVLVELEAEQESGEENAPETVILKGTPMVVEVKTVCGQCSKETKV